MNFEQPPDELSKNPEEEQMENNQQNTENHEPERKITSPEEAAEMTRSRRRQFGLGEAGELSKEETEQIETDIQNLLAELYEYDFDSLDPVTQNEWLFVDQEACVGKDRELAKAVLQKFLKVLRQKRDE